MSAKAGIAAALLAACFTAAFAINPAIHSTAAAHAQKQAAIKKPPSGAGNDTCRYAHDNECDEPEIGTGFCAAGSDYSDCRYLREGERDACQYARDGECDEPNFGTGACTQGSDRTDCGDVRWLRNANDSCATAFNGVCDEPGRGGGTCAARTDRSDCHGRERPMSIHDHFFGRDDRVLVNPAQFPWRTIGVLVMAGGEECTATLIADDVVVTAAHCIHAEGGLNANADFSVGTGVRGGPFTAHVVGYFFDPHFNVQRFSTTNDIDGTDWALLRLDRPLGATLGHVGVANLTGQGSARATAAPLYQAGFGWDTGGHLAANLGCHMVHVYDDNTFAHECDTTRGDSGSALMIRDGENYSVIGVDSNFRSNPGGHFLYIAVSAAGFQRYVDDFVAGRIGVNMRGGKPK